MFCSTIIPTVGRSTLTRAVNSVLNQNFPQGEFEIIIVNDSGHPLPKESWLNSKQIQIIHTNHRERCIARNAGAAIAKGKYLHFLDDDDWLLPDALTTFKKLDEQTDVAWLYGGTQLVTRNANPLIKLQHDLTGNCFTQVIAGEWVPLQASLISSQAFFEIGGFHPLIPGAEDIDIARHIILYGEMHGTDTLVACVGMGEMNSTTNYHRAVLDARRARERLLSNTGAFRRMLTSTKDNSYWHGRILRAYITSFIWNIRHKRGLTAASRFTFGVVGFIASAQHILSPTFWQAVTHRHEGEAFLRGWQEAIMYNKGLSAMPPPPHNALSRNQDDPS